MKEEVKRWWELANDDLRKAKDNYDIGNHDLCSFLCQQAVEKALKALLLEKESELIKTHDLVLLAKRLKLPNNFIQICKELSPVYVETRYPDARGSVKKYSKEESKEDLDFASELIRWIKKKI